MASITTYDALAAAAAGLTPGDTLTIGVDAVAPAMLDTLEALSLAFALTVATATTERAPPTTTVTGTATLFGIADLATTLVFAPQEEDRLGGPFVMTVTATPATPTRWDLATGFGVDKVTLDFVPAEATPTYTASIGCDLVVGQAGALDLPVTLTLPTYPGLDWTAAGTFAQHPLSADALAALMGGLTLSDYLPSPLDEVARFGLTEVSIAFSPDRGVSQAYFVVAYTAPWSLLDIIDVPAGGVTLALLIATGKTAQSYVELDAQFTIATVPVEIGAHLAPGDIQLWGRLQQGRSVSIAALFDHFKVTLPADFPEVDVDRLALMVDIGAGTYTFDFGATVAVGSAFSIDGLSAHVAVATTPRQVAAHFAGTIVLGEGTTIFLAADYDGGGGGLTLVGEASDVPIGLLLDYWAVRFGIDAVPEPIRSLALKTLAVRYNTATGDLHFRCVGDFTVYRTPVEMVFTVDILHGAGRGMPAGAVTGTAGYSATFGGSVTFADLTFDLRFNTKETGAKILVADYAAAKGAATVNLHDLVADVSTDLAAVVPADLSIGIDALKFAWLRDEQALGHFLFGVELGASLALADVPVIGDKLPPDATVAFDQLQFTYASRTFTDAQARAVNALLPVAVARLPATGLAAGVLVSGELRLGEMRRTIALPIAAGGASGTRLAAGSAATAAAPAALSIDVQRQFGPVAIRKLGLLYDRQRLFVTGDIALDAALLSIGLLGLGIGSSINRFDPAVTLSGLTIAIDDGPIKVQGGLLGTIDPLDFYGALSVTLPSLSIGALGGYAQKGADPSFFLYAAVDRPLFGYPFFYLDGLAAGIGFNRDLVLPDIDGVAGFPLVRWAVGGGAPSADPSGDVAAQVATVVTALADAIPPRIGEYWVAAGIKFSSFGILHSFALLTVAFGTEFKIALLGLTTASLPPDTPGVPPIGYVEMALSASFSPANGIVQVAAKLTPASYILTGACRLTGGFAYYTWLKDDPSGDHASYRAGDFVVTLGGYHPAFDRPRYYPVEPLLGFNWRVDDNTGIKGGIYFALTPAVMMAGGRLEAVWESGDLRAWFIAHADFLLSWKPFFYAADLGLGIGVSFKIDLGFTSYTVSLSIGVELALWGPSFGGRIDVDLSLISFTVWIGNRDKPPATPIGWAEFKKSFLPPPATLSARTPAAAGDPVATDSYCHASVAAGLVQDMTTARTAPTDPDWVVNPALLELVTFSAFPIKAASLAAGDGQPAALPVGNLAAGVGPVAIADRHLASTHAIAVRRRGDGLAGDAIDLADLFVAVPILANMPAAAWGGQLVVAPSIGSVNATAPAIAGVVVGYSLRPVPRAPDHTPLPIAIDVLEHELDATVAFAWTTPVVAVTDPFDQSTAMATFAATLRSSASVRRAVIGALGALEPGLDPFVDIDALADEAAATLLAPPTLRYLGECRAA